MAETIRESYIQRNPKSAALFPRFQEIFPSGGGGHDGYVADPFPITIDHGQGSRKWDVDGNEYIDYGLGSASLLLGHAHPEVVDALMRAAPGGSHYGAPIEQVLEWGERVCNLIPCADKVRFVGSGAEATMLALRVARAYSGKDKIYQVGIPLPRLARLCNAGKPSAFRCSSLNWDTHRRSGFRGRAAA